MSYSVELVEQLIPTVWDRSWAWGMQNESSPDPDMPKAKVTDPKQATTFWCHLIDVRRAWEQAPLTLGERRALLLRYGYGWEHEEIGRHELVSKQAIGKRLSFGLGKLVDFLNV